MQTKYTVNYWYDDIDKNNPYQFVLKNSDTFSGVVGQTIENIDDITYGFYFRASATLPLTLGSYEDSNVINIYYTRAYRTYIYDLVKSSLSERVVTEDLDVFLKLVACVYGDLYTLSKNIDDSINIDFIDEEHLRHLSKLIGYTWVEALTADEQRESIKFYMYLRRMRGTSFGLKNLIKIFGKTSDNLYQATSVKGVRVMEYKEGNKYKLLPGDIRIEIPELSQILRDSANDVKLVGTRLIFAYRVDIGSTNKDTYGHMLGYYPAPAVVTNHIKLVLQPGLKGWDIPQDFSKTDQFDDKFIYKYSDEYNVHASSEITIHYAAPFISMWLFQLPGLENVRGIITEEGIIDENLVLYR